jgi:hypothetical protein
MSICIVMNYMWLKNQLYILSCRNLYMWLMLFLGTNSNGWKEIPYILHQGKIQGFSSLPWIQGAIDVTLIHIQKLKV